MPVPPLRPWRAALWPSLLLILLALLAPALAQSGSNSQSASAPATSAVLSLTTSTTTLTTTIRSGNQNIPITTTVATVFNVTVTPTPTPTPSPTSSSSASASATSSAAPDFTKLDTQLDPGFGVLGALLILTGLPSAFLGHKNRWSSFFLIGFYTLALTCFVLILRFGVLNAINPPSKTLRGLFVLSCGVAGVAGGGISIFFWKAAKYFIGAWGGFALALWIQCFRNGGLIGPIGFRWIMYIGTRPQCCTPASTDRQASPFLPVSSRFCGRLRVVHAPEAALLCPANVDSLRWRDRIHARRGLLHDRRP